MRFETKHNTNATFSRLKSPAPALLMLITSSALTCVADAADAAGQVDADAAPLAQQRVHSRPHPTASKAELRRLIDAAAQRHGVEPALVHAVVAAESAYDAHAVSPAGAVGVMQLMPGTARDYGVGSHTALLHPPTNIDAGVRHLKRLLQKYRGDYGRVIMAYNAGEGAVDRTNSNVRYPETLDYTEAVARRYRALGGTKSTTDLLRKVSALRRSAGTTPPKRQATRQRDPFGLLPAASAQLENRLPNTVPETRVSPQRLSEANDSSGDQLRPILGRGIRPGNDPVIRDAARRRSTPPMSR